MENEIYYLVVDDELTANENDREDTIRHMGVPEELGLFAENYEEAMEILSSDRAIGACFVDYKIPKNNQHPKANYENNLEKCWGIELIPQIKALKNSADIIIYSAYVTEEYLQNASGEFNNLVTAFFEKPHGLDRRRDYYLQAINKNYKSSSNLILKYEGLDPQTQNFILDRTNKIQGLLKKTVENMLAIGYYLNEVKELLPFGQFTKWYESELGISNTSVARMMTAATRLTGYTTEDLLSFGIATLYHLTDRSIPDLVLDTIITDQDIAKSISSENAKQLKEHFKKQKKQQKKNIAKASKSISAASSTPVVDNQTTKPKLSPTLSITSDLLSRPLESQKRNDVKQEIIKVLHKPVAAEPSEPKVWRIGDKQQHVIVAAEPNSPSFLRQLTPNISLCIAFPSQQNWQFQFKHCDTINIFHSRDQNLENWLFLALVDNLICGTTYEDEINKVAICYIPELKILSKIHAMGCHAYIADPDYQKCLDLISTFKS